MRSRLIFTTATAVTALAISAGAANAAVVLATATINNPTINIGNYHRGSTPTAKGISITNTVTGSPQQKLDGNVGGKTGGVTFTTGGFFTLLAPGATNNVAIKVAIDTATVGNKSGTVLLKFVSDGAGTNGINTDLPSQTVNVTGAVFDYADPTINTPLIALGNYHVGDAVTPHGVSITNTVMSNAAYQEGLDAIANGSTGGVIGQGSIALLGAGSTNNTGITVSIDTSSAGDKSGTASILLKSDGTGTSNLGNTSLPSQTVSVTGAAYDYASSSSLAPVDFGIHHVGDPAVMQALSITNTAPASAYSEGLDSSFGGFSGTGGSMLGTSGAIGNLAAGATDSASMVLSLSTAGAGVLNGNITVHQASNGSATSGLGTTTLTDQTVVVTGQVNAYAHGSLVQTGGAGTLTGSGASYLIDFGSLNQYSAGIGVDLGVMNDVAAPGDALSGHFTLPGLPGDLDLSGFSDFAVLDPGALDGGLNASLNTNITGFFDVFVTLDLFGSNASGYYDVLPMDSTITLEIKGNVVPVGSGPPVPEPISLSLFGAGLIGAGYARARRKKAKV